MKDRKDRVWKLEPDTYWVRGLTGRPAAAEIRDLVQGCEDMLKQSWPQRYIPKGGEA